MTYPLSQDSADPTPPARRAARIYVAILLTGLLLFAAFMGGLAWRLGPPAGDLGRISGLGSRDFGRQETATGYAGNHFTLLSYDALMAGAAPGDLLVFGDSFSFAQAGGISWLNTLAHRSGMRPTSVEGSSFPGLLNYLASGAFAADPPGAILVQTVERSLVTEALSIHDPADCPVVPGGAPARLSAISGPEPAGIALPPQKGFATLEDMLSWAALSIRTRIKGTDRAVIRTLSRADLFSNRASDRLLLYYGDFENHAPEAIAPLTPTEARSRITCGLGRLVAAAGDMPLWVVIAPDKRSVYDPWIVPPDPPKVIDIFDHLDRVLGERFINLRPVLREAVETGARDVYWPDDTHWGAVGNRLSGEAVAAEILHMAGSRPD